MVEMEPLAIRNDEAHLLKPEEKEKLNQLLEKHSHIFTAGGEPCPFAEHRIDTGTNTPVSVPPYRMAPAKQEILRNELIPMLEQNIIEECESAWGRSCRVGPQT